ncbi:MAG: NAD(P)/FAD-dependent oxidoreductase [Chloroflexota bacterium]
MYDVIIIGAGFAGVTAGRELSRRGLHALILEGRDRIGGRTWRTEHEGQQFELGGAYIHWAQPHVLAEVTRYGLSIVPGADAAVQEVRVLSDGALHIFDVEQGYTLLSDAYTALYQADPHPDQLFSIPYDPLTHNDWMDHAHTSLEDQVKQLKLDPILQDALSAMLATDMNASLQNVALIEMLRLRALVGSNDFQKLAEVSGTYVISGGTTALLQCMLQDSTAEIHTGQVVTHIDQTGHSVVLQTKDGSRYETQVVIVATPLNTWANLVLVPALSDAKTTVSRQRHAGAGFKCFVRLTGQMPGLLALAPEPHPFSFLTTSQVEDDSTWMIGFGPIAPEAFTPAWAQAALEPLIPDVWVSEVYGHNWSVDPFSQGTWANYKPNQAVLLNELTCSEGRVFFASADIALGWRGYIDGAIESGLRSARQVQLYLGGESCK